MSPCELTATVTAVANMIASKLSDDEITVLAPVLIQIGYTLETIHAQREACEKRIDCKNVDAST